MNLTQQQKSPQQKTAEILKLIQYLYHYSEITTSEKNKLVAELSTARKTNDFSQILDKLLAYDSIADNVWNMF